MPPRDALAQMRREAQRALEIDPALPEGHAMLGTAAAMFDYDWPEAERQFQLALADGAAPPHLHRYYAQYCLLPLKRWRDAFEHYEVALRDDPLNVSARADRAVCLGGGGRQLDAEADMREVMRLDPSFWFPYFILSHWRALDGRVDEGLELAERSYALAPWFLPLIGVLAVLLQRKGLVDRSRELVATLEGDGQRDPIGPAMYHLLRDELDACADWVERAIEERQPAIFFFAHVTASKLHPTSRWPKILQLMRLQ